MISSESPDRIWSRAPATKEPVPYVSEVAGETLLPGCNSWYFGTNVPGKLRVFMPYLDFSPYVERFESVASNEYEGFRLS